VKRFFQRRFGCYGLTLPLGRGRQLELWLAPRHAFIPRHVHPHIRSTLIFLGGRMAWWRDEQPGKLMTWRHIGRAFAVPPECAHAAMTFGGFGLFANFERWLPGVPMTSAATDLELREIGEDNLEGRKAGTEEGKSLFAPSRLRCSLLP
jgi:hypothetical protein